MNTEHHQTTTDECNDVNMAYRVIVVVRAVDFVHPIVKYGLIVSAVNGFGSSTWMILTGLIDPANSTLVHMNTIRSKVDIEPSQFRPKFVHTWVEIKWKKS